MYLENKATGETTMCEAEQKLHGVLSERFQDSAHSHLSCLRTPSYNLGGVTPLAYVERGGCPNVAVESFAPSAHGC